MERVFLGALRADTPGGDDAEGTLGALLEEPADAYGVSHHLCERGERWQLREFAAHRSAYHLKEADPHAWVIPRLRGRAKASLVAVEFDEFGGGRAEAVHAVLFAGLMDDLGLDSRYGRYLDLVPAPMLAIVSMMSLFGLHRGLRGAMVGHFAAAEITTAPAARRMARAARRLGAGPRCVRFYTEHIEADAVHEQVLRHEVVGDLLAREPELAADVAFGAQATGLLEDRFGEHVLACWRAGRSSLRRPLPSSPTPRCHRAERCHAAGRCHGIDVTGPMSRDCCHGADVAGLMSQGWCHRAGITRPTRCQNRFRAGRGSCGTGGGWCRRTGSGRWLRRRTTRP
ncbi:iron-containing redox enzyme family protein [Actinomadura keratinilytica]|uniref:iron-containing redox enzyme family protein n=1 Tax=Actinomadura keratinilytica TaxID=547461 RepID=UPI0036151114